jgi:hypothetical protein
MANGIMRRDAAGKNANLPSSGSAELREGRPALMPLLESLPLSCSGFVAQLILQNETPQFGKIYLVFSSAGIQPVLH